jgi:hypothetical protein
MVRAVLATAIVADAAYKDYRRPRMIRPRRGPSATAKKMDTPTTVTCFDNGIHDANSLAPEREEEGENGADKQGTDSPELEKKQDNRI